MASFVLHCPPSSVVAIYGERKPQTEWLAMDKQIAANRKDA